jgi:predicted RNase H-like nuclease (RuvC/YqgF family)|tara:strand:+ start:240 stop:491 length:252 start_codon:yes stop_codon:yes gene_type:complete
MAVNLDRGLNDLEDSIDRLIKQKEYLQRQLRKTKSNRAEEIMALYAEVKRLKNENEDLRMYEIKSKYKIQNLEKELHDRKTND